MASLNKYTSLILALLQCSFADMDDPVCFERQGFEDGTSIFIKTRCKEMAETLDSKIFDSIDDFSLAELLKFLDIPLTSNIQAKATDSVSCPTTVSGKTTLDSTTAKATTQGNEQTTTDTTSRTVKTTQQSTEPETTTKKVTTQGNVQTTIDTTTRSETTTQKSTESATTTTSPTSVLTTTQVNAETTVPAGCVQVFHADNYTVTSPNYPSNYPDNVDCEYEIVASTENSIRVQFDNFDVEADGSCGKDFVEIFDKASGTTSLTDKMCTNTIPPTRVFDTHHIVIMFHSDSSNNNGGFSISFQFISSTSCNVIYVNENSVITSSNYPDSYPLGEMCENWIQAPVGKTIQLTFTDFQVEAIFPSFSLWSAAYDWSEWDGEVTTPKFKACFFDFVKVYDGVDGMSNVIFSQLCGMTPPPPLISTSNNLYIFFKSDNIGPKPRGYRATYKFI